MTKYWATWEIEEEVFNNSTKGELLTIMRRKSDVKFASLLRQHKTHKTEILSSQNKRIY